jgi:sulfur carrier protein
MVDIIVNGKEMKVQKGTTLLQLMESLGIAGKVMAAAIDMEIVKKDEWKSRILEDGERVELMHFVGGG